MNTMTVSVSPHIRSKRTTQKVMLDVIIALMPALIAAIILWGFKPFLLTLISVVVCVLAEFCYEKIMKRPVTINDLSAVVTGILIAFNVPVDMPIWQLIIGDLFAIIVAKMLFGGLGRNFMNPALVGRIVMMFSFTASITTYRMPAGTVDALTSATPLPLMENLDWSYFMDLFLGVHGGVFGETCCLALIIGGIYLCIRKVIKPIIPVCYIFATAFFTWIFGGPQPILSIFAGGLLLGAIFMATDYVTSPITNWGKVIFGLFCGLVLALIRVFGNYAEGVTFSIILANLLVPYINQLTMRKPLGAIIEDKKKKGKEA